MLFVIIPKGFFPQQDTGLITGISEAAQDISPRRDDAASGGSSATSSLQGPGRRACRPIGDRRRRQSAQYRAHVHHPEAARRTRAPPRDQIIARLRPQLAKVEGAQLFLQPAQDVTRRRPLARTQYQYTLQDADLDELNDWAPKMLAKLQTLPELRDVATDQQTDAHDADADHRSRPGARASASSRRLIDDTLYDAFGQRQVTQYFTQLNHLLRDPGGPAELQDDLATLDQIYVKSPTTGGVVPLSTLRRVGRQRRIEPLSINHQGQFPAVTLSFNLAPGVALGQAVDAISRRADEARHARAASSRSFQGNAQAFQSSLASDAAADRWRRWSPSISSSACSMRATSIR